MEQARVTADVAALPRRPSVVSIGFFDGVHRGHRSIIDRTLEVARRQRLRSVVVTFDRHPMEVIRPDRAPRLLMTARRRAGTLARSGVDRVVMLAFDDELRTQSADDFVAAVLREALDARHVVVGENFRFGHRAAGDVDLLRSTGAAAGFGVDAVGLRADAEGPISSTRIRAALDVGDVEAAAEMLGRPYVVDGTVVAGDGRGRGLGYPTANLAYDPRCVIPAAGVYAGVAGLADGRARPAVTSIGTNPTFDGVELRVEAHLLDFDEDLYGVDVAVDLRRRIRGQERFSSVDDLVAAMDRDVVASRRALGDVDLVAGGGG